MSDKRARDMENLRSRGRLWVPDDETPNCLHCESSFTLFNRRHHCRICGNIYCSDCTPHEKSYPDVLDHHDKVRVCKPCDANGGKPDVGGEIKTYTVVGYQDCQNHQRVADVLATLVGKYPHRLRGEIVGADTREDYMAWLEDKTEKLNIKHTESPICFEGTEDDGVYIGGADEFLKFLQKKFSNDLGSEGGSGGCLVQ